MSNLSAASSISHISSIALGGSLDPRRSDAESAKLMCASEKIWQQAEDKLAGAILAGEFAARLDPFTIADLRAEDAAERAGIDFIRGGDYG